MKKFRKNIVSLLLFFFLFIHPDKSILSSWKNIIGKFFHRICNGIYRKTRNMEYMETFKDCQTVAITFNGYVLSCTMYASWSLPPIPSRQEEKTAIVVSYFSTPEFPLFRLADGSFERERVSRKTETVALGWSLSNSRKRAAKEKGRIRSVPTKTIVIPLRSTHLSTHRVSIFLFLDDNNFDGTKIMI